VTCDPPLAPAAAAARWDERLAAARSPHLLQSWGWGAVQASAGWRAHRLWVEGADGPLPVLALVSARGPARLPGLRRIYVPRGPALGPDDIEGYRAVAGVLGSLARRTGAVRVDVEVPWEAGAVPADHPWRAGIACDPRQPWVTSIVDLAGSVEDRLGRCHPKTRYNIRLAERRGVTVTTRRDLSALVACVRATARRQGIHLPGAAHLAAVTAALGPGAQTLVADVDGEVVAAILLGVFANEAIYLYGGATGRHRELMPNYLLHWSAMELAVRMGCGRYDLWGMPPTADPSHPWHGLRQFKLGFGGRTVTLAGSRSLLLSPLRARLLDGAEAGLRRWRPR